MCVVNCQRKIYFPIALILLSNTLGASSGPAPPGPVNYDMKLLRLFAGANNASTCIIIANKDTGSVVGIEYSSAYVSAYYI